MCKFNKFQLYFLCIYHKSICVSRSHLFFEFGITTDEQRDSSPKSGGHEIKETTAPILYRENRYDVIIMFGVHYSDTNFCTDFWALDFP